MITTINCKFNDEFDGMGMTADEVDRVIDQIEDKLLERLTVDYPSAKVCIEFEHRIGSKIEVESDEPADDQPWSVERDIESIAGEITEQVITDLPEA